MEMMKKLGLVALVALLAAAGYIVVMKHCSSANVKIQTVKIGKSADDIADDINAAMITAAQADLDKANKNLAAAQADFDKANNSNDSFKKFKRQAELNVAVQKQKDAQKAFDDLKNSQPISA